jgi:hypothetical protein
MLGLRFCADCWGVEAAAAAAPFTDGWLEGEGRGAAAPALLLMGACKLVERFRMSLPWTTMLSFDFFRSRVSISAVLLVPWFIVWDKKSGTVAPRVEVYDRAYADVDDAEEALVLLLELLLVKDLNGEDTLLVDAPSSGSAVVVHVRAGHDVHVEALVPVGVQRLLNDARGARLLAIDRGHGEGIREAYTAVRERCIREMRRVRDIRKTSRL